MLNKLLFFLNPKDKMLALGILSLMLGGAVLEATGIALVFPLIAVISNPASVEKNGFLRQVYDFSGMQTTDSFLIWMVGLLLAFYIFKYIFLAFLYYAQYWFIFDVQTKLSTRLLNTYLRSPYTFHLQRNSADILRTINMDVIWIFSGFLVPGSSALIEIFVIAVIVLVLLYAAPLATIATLVVLGSTSLAFYLFIRRRATQLGLVQQANHGQMIKWVNQGLGGIKEIKILGREDFFIRAYDENNIGYGRAMRYLRTFQDFPRLLIEALVMGGILFVIGFMILLDQNVQLLIPTLGLFAMAAVRLMPSMNRILSGLTSMRYYASSVDKVYEDLKELEDVPLESDEAAKNAESNFQFNKSIKLENVGYSYPEVEKNALQNINLTIQKGQSIAFVGSSGAGKTTMVDVILGLLDATEGRILVDGVNINTNTAAWQRKIGYIPQPIYLSDDTVRRNIAFGVDDDKIDDEQIWSALKAAQLEEFTRALPDKLDTLVGEHGVRISGGQRQRIGIARALYHNPEILILDEATAALDNETEREVTKAIEALGGSKTIIAIAHRLTTVKNFDCLFYMKNGEIIEANNFDNLLQNNTDFQRMANTAAISENPATALN